MKVVSIFEDNGHVWKVFGRDPKKITSIIDTNQYLIQSGNEAIVLDPGGVEIFAPMLSALLHHVNIGEIKYLFASHQDPDIISSLGYWDKALEGATLHAPAIWEGFIKHFGCNNIDYKSIPDEGAKFNLNGVELQFVPAHYMHSSGNFNVYDPKAKILMSGDIGAAIEGHEAPMFVENFDEHVKKMIAFHQRWMPSMAAKKRWIDRVRKLDIDIMAPQHGRMFKGEDVGKFLDWFEKLEVGIAN